MDALEVMAGLGFEHEGQRFDQTGDRLNEGAPGIAATAWCAAAIKAADNLPADAFAAVQQALSEHAAKLRKAGGLGKAAIAGSSTDSSPASSDHSETPSES